MTSRIITLFVICLQIIICHSIAIENKVIENNPNFRTFDSGLSDHKNSVNNHKNNDEEGKHHI